jgi:beta-lactamase superfamily II metal-dependent hydrolase
VAGDLYSIGIDLANVWSAPAGGRILRTVGWGTRVTVLDATSKPVPVQTRVFRERDDGTVTWTSQTGYVRLDGRSFASVFRPPQTDVLRVDFVDVQQGDAAVVETPSGRVMLIDGGDNQLFARYLATRYRSETAGTSKVDPFDVAAIVVTHGDADHFAGLAEIQESETYPTSYPGGVRKRLFIRPHLVVHNGLVKRPGKVPEGDKFGHTVTVGGDRFVVDLVDDLTALDDAEMNVPFRHWKATLRRYQERYPGTPIQIQRLDRGMPSPFADLAADGLTFEILGPTTHDVPDGAATRRGLPFLHAPSTTVALEDLAPSSALSASHTINGHSIVFRMTYGGVRFLFTGDLTAEAAATLLGLPDVAGEPAARAEVFKVPHHGSADYATALLKAISPVVSVISSGDESEGKEYIHPRANLLGSLGRFSRTDRPAIFCTELSAFFAVKGWIDPEYHALTAEGEKVVKRRKRPVVDPADGPYFVFTREAWGTIHIRTDGYRFLAWADSAKDGLKEPYAFTITDGAVKASGITKV